MAAAVRFPFKTAAIVLMAALGVGLAVWYVGFDDPPAPEKADASFRARRIKERKQSRDKDKKNKPRVSHKKVPVSPEALAQLRKDMQLEVDEVKQLTGKMLAIYKELQEALDKNDRKRVFSLVHTLQAMDEWPDGIPASVKKRALAALAWFGAPGIAEAVGFLADSDPEIRQTATETFEQQFMDNWDLGDVKLGETMKSMVKVVTETSALETFFDQFDNMRPSVKADTAIAIYESKNENAIKVLESKMGDIFDSADFDYEVKDLDGIRKYQKDAQAAEQDSQTKQEYDDRYGPSEGWNW